MKVTYVDHMGSDNLVVDAARVSFDKKAENFTDTQNKGLVNFLGRNNHWTPFGHPHVCLHFKAPLFVARQLGKHQVGMVWNEVSRRYVDSVPELYWPEVWRGKAADKKQGSSEEVVEVDDRWFYDVQDSAVDAYNYLLDAGVCPEQARMVLPQSTYTEWYWTGSLAAWARVYNLRSKPDAQQETQSLVFAMESILDSLFPNSWQALTNEDTSENK